MTIAPRASACAFCGTRLDVWRAPRARVSAERQLFFCSPAHAELFSFEANHAAPPPAPDFVDGDRSVSALASTLPAASEPNLPWAEPIAPTSAEAPAKAALGGATRARAFPVQAALRLGPASLAAFSFLWCAHDGEPLGAAVALVAVLLISAVAQERIAEWLERDTVQARARVRERLDVPAHRLREGRLDLLSADEVRPGEELLVGSGEWVAVDCAVVEGEGTLEPWPDARDGVTVRPGSRILAGARLLSGQLRVTCTASGPQRALVPLVERGPRRLDRSLGAARFAAWAGLGGAPLLAAVLGILGYLLGESASRSLGLAAAAWGAFSGALLLHLPAELGARRLLVLGRGGVFFPSAALVENAGHASVVVLCARGTVLYGEPEVADVEALRDESVERVLALAAGAESVIPHPIASAVLRAAELRNLAPDAARHHQPVQGLGVVCVSSRGMPLVVGSRELLLRERISIALAEETLRRYEAQGKTALLVAEDGHLLGVLSLVDGLRAGARVMVERLASAGFEPVLLSGDSRRTTEAVGAALGIEHLRPEIPSTERGAEIQRLAGGGAIVAVVGRTSFDDNALHAAQVPLVLGLPTLGMRDRAVAVVSERPLDAAWALTVAHGLGQRTWSGLLLAWVPAALVSVAAGSLLIPAWLAPAFAALGAGVSAVWLLRGGAPEPRPSD